jgi:peptide/nickel transport system permease protein
MVSRKGIQFQLGRAGGLFRLLLRNRMATIGLILIIGFSFIALAAPVISPVNPTTIVSGSFAEPEWVSNFPDGHYLSKNIVLAKDPNFVSPSALNEWNFSITAGSATDLQYSYSPDVSALANPGGSLKITHAGSSPATIVVSRDMLYPFLGPPNKFIASYNILPFGTDLNHPVSVRLFIDRLGDQDFNIWNEHENVTGQWGPPGGSNLDSRGGLTNSSIRATIGEPSYAIFDPSAIIFSKAQAYTFRIEVSFTGQQTVYIDNLQLKLLGTSWGILGTDNGGTDLFAQLIYGSRISLLVGLTASGIGIGLGLVVGLMAGYLGRVVDEVLMRFTDMMLVIPGLPLLIVLVAVLGQSIWNVIIIIGFLGWMGFARIVRSQVLTLRERPFVEAAKASGAGPMRIISKHIFPNIVSLTYVNLALSVPAAILSESALAFLGLSDPTVTSWGNTFEHLFSVGALQNTPSPWWWVLPPGFAIALISLSFVLIGYALDEIFNPKLRKRR